MNPDSPVVEQTPRSCAPSKQGGALHTGCLILTPTDPHLAPDVDLVIEGLSQAGLLGKPLGYLSDERAFALGPGFLSLLSFTGCAVQLPEHLVNGDAGAPIRITPISPYPRLLAGRNTRPPRCLGCRAPLVDWRDLVDYWATHPHAGVCCQNCGETRPPWLWDWKQQGGFGRLFVRIEEVFPGETMPSQALFTWLIHISGTSWRYFYIQE